MEKFGLFDLIDKFNAQTNGKKNSNRGSIKENPNSLSPSETEDFSLSAPSVPPHYAMNNKMQEFCKRHDRLSKKIGESNKS